MAPSTITEDYYKILEVEQTAGLDLIVRSYRRLALKLHPDRNVERNTTEAFQKVRQIKFDNHRFGKRSKFWLTHRSLGKLTRL